jgi:hypothetical protein
MSLIKINYVHDQFKQIWWLRYLWICRTYSNSVELTDIRYLWICRTYSNSVELTDSLSETKAPLQ